jgi:hypothetical protein
MIQTATMDLKLLAKVKRQRNPFRKSKKRLRTSLTPQLRPEVEAEVYQEEEGPLKNKRDLNQKLY